MREENGVELTAPRGIELTRLRTQDQGSVAKQRVREQPDAVELDEDGRVPDERQPHVRKR